jgi:hypothetical protein
MGKGPLVAQLATNGAALASAMQQLVDRAFSQVGDQWDYLVFYEHDMIPPLDAFDRVAEYNPEEHHIVGAMYFARQPPHSPTVSMKLDRGANQAPDYVYPTPELTKQMVEAPALYEVESVGTGFTAIHRTVFEKWDKNIRMWEAQEPILVHDMWFCLKAKEQGFKVWVDSGIVCGHITERAVSYDDYRRYQQWAG